MSKNKIHEIKRTRIQKLKTLKILCFSMLIFAIILTAASCKKNNAGSTGTDDEFTPSSGLILTAQEALDLKNKVGIMVYFVNADCTQLVGGSRYMELSEAKQSTENIAGAIVTDLLKGPDANDTGAKKIIPEGTKMLAPVTIAGSLAVVNLSKEFVDNSSDVKKEVEMSIYSLVNSVTEIKELDRVKILIDGKEINTLKGIVDMNMPFKRNQSLISVNQASAADNHASTSASASISAPALTGTASKADASASAANAANPANAGNADDSSYDGVPLE